jgi:hypothetical protein
MKKDASKTTPPGFHVLLQGVDGGLKMHLDVPNIFAHITKHGLKALKYSVHLL